MMRPISGAFQLIRNYIKPIILLVSFGTFIWLILSTTNRPEFTRHADKHRTGASISNQPSNRWSESSVEVFLSLLDIDENVTSLARNSVNNPCPLKDEIIFTAFADNDLEESLWQYYTMIALRQNAQFKTHNSYPIKPFLPKSTKLQLEEIFARVPMDIIGNLSFDCYDLAGAAIINSASEINPPQQRNQIFILDTGTRRFRDLISADWNMESEYLRPEDAEMAQTRLQKFLKNNVNGDKAPEFVGIYIRQDDQLPFEFYYRAVTFQRKIHSSRIIVLVICENPKGAICQKLNAPREEVYVEPSAIGSNPALEFALMVACNHTIISNQMGIFHALVSGGDVVVYEHEDPMSRGHYLPWLIATEMENWYMLG